MRACSRVALVLVAVSASGLAGCAAIDELKEAFLRWVESEKLPSGGGDLPEATPTTPAEKPLQERPSQAPRKPIKEARKPPQPQPQIIALPREKPPLPDSTEAARPEGSEGQSAPPPPTPPQLPSRWPPRTATRTFFTLRSGRALTGTVPRSASSRACARWKSLVRSLTRGGGRTRRATVLTHYRSNDNDGLLDRKRQDD
jgi:hypothetical protein